MTVDVGERIRCNCCGGDLDFFDQQQDLIIHKQMQYGSEYDGEKIKLRFCNECFDKIIDKCAVSPVVKAKIRRKPKVVRGVPGVKMRHKVVAVRKANTYKTKSDDECDEMSLLSDMVKAMFE